MYVEDSVFALLIVLGLIFAVYASMRLMSGKTAVPAFRRAPREPDAPPPPAMLLLDQQQITPTQAMSLLGYRGKQYLVFHTATNMILLDTFSPFEADE